jgi:hypothetical protein
MAWRLGRGLGLARWLGLGRLGLGMLRLWMGLGLGSVVGLGLGRLGAFLGVATLLCLLQPVVLRLSGSGNLSVNREMGLKPRFFVYLTARLEAAPFQSRLGECA